MANPFRQGPIALQDTPEPLPAGAIIHLDDPDGLTKIDQTSATTELPDGSAIVHVDWGGPARRKPANSNDFYRNLAEEIPESELNALAYELCLGIEADIQSVAERNADLATGIKMLGVKLEEPTQQESSAGSAPTEGMSRVYHPLINDAILRFQATASGELLPAEGPVKVENAGQQTDANDEGAQALENAMNLYFTKTASEYYPDTKRALYDTGFSGSSFKKCYICPIRRRPVSESIASKHFVVANAARDLKSCGRKTHLIEMEPSVFLRMQKIGVYRDVYLPEPLGSSANPVDRATNEALGVKPDAMNPKDRYRNLYETYAKIDLPGFEDVEKKGGEPTGLPLPFRVTIDVESKEILEVRRNWDKDDAMKTENRVFVKYPYVEALGFYGLGLFHILGNIARALTAGWRVSLDGGMLSNFPGFLYDKRAGRQLTNEFRVPAGGGVPLEVPAGLSIKDVASAIPYKDVSAGFMALLETLQAVGEKLGGTAEMSIGEGRQDAPVGTTLALLEQATKVTDAVHKGLHAAQAEEFQIMKELFEDDPEALWRHSPRESETWDKDQIVEALKRCDLVPRADPNTPSQMHRIAKVTALVQLAQQAPQQFDLAEISELAVRTLGFANARKYLAKTPPGATPDPKDQAAADKAIAAKTSAQADLQDSQTKAAELEFKKQTFGAQMQNDAEERQEDLENTRLKFATEQTIHAGNQQIDRAKIAAQQQSQAASQQHERAMHAIDTQADLTKTAVGHGADALAQSRDHAHEKTIEAMKPKPTPGES